jgi:heat shock protein HslJ
MHDSSSLPLGPTPLCVRYRPQLALLHTGALSPREAAVLNEHISSCPWCQRELAAYDELDAAARQHLADVAFTPLTLEDIMHATQTPRDANLASTHGASREIRPALRRRPRLSTLGPLAAVVVLALLAGLIFATHSSGAGVASGGKPKPTAPTHTANLTQTTWTLTRLVVDGREQQLVPGRAPTLYFGRRNGQIDGVGGCNSYGGTYTLAGDTLHLTPGFQTQVRCLPTGVMEQEYAYLHALPRVERYHLDGNTLMLTSADGSVQLTFRAN